MRYLRWAEIARRAIRQEIKMDNEAPLTISASIKVVGRALFAGTLGGALGAAISHGSNEAALVGGLVAALATWRLGIRHEVRRGNVIRLNAGN